jgi:hypothetical protein
MARTTWHDVLIDAAKPVLNRDAFVAVWLLEGPGLPTEVDDGWYIDGGQACRRACHQANKTSKRRVAAVYVVERRGDRFYVYGTASRDPKVDNRFRSHKRPLEDPLHVGFSVTSNVRGRLSPLAV